MAATSIPRPRRADLRVQALGADGQHVVKDLRTGTFFQLPPQEAFLLLQLDGSKDAATICAEFSQRFGEELDPAGLDEFLEVAEAQHLLENPTSMGEPSAAPKQRDFSVSKLTADVLYWRFRFFDPDRLFTWLEPRLSFLWTAAFLWLSLAVVAFASWQLWLHWNEYASYLLQSLRWETLVLAWVILFAVTMAHEFAHGLTCKHYGGEVHEVGFLLMFFMPCFYCNVSDAWLMPEKSKRIWITMAGGYCDLCMWAAATLVWRVTLPYTLPYHCAWVVMSICGGRVFLNFNPFVKLDGYYMLSDWLEIPNLRRRALDRVAAWLRCLLWGASRPSADEHGRVVFWFGLASWSFSLFYVGLMFYALYKYWLASWGILGLTMVALMGWIILPGLLSGLFEGEVMKMLRKRPLRLAIWALVLIGVPTVLAFIGMEERVGGSFKLRPIARQEVRAKVSGFLHAVHFAEGERVSHGAVVAVLEIPDLATRLAQKQAEVAEVQAKLRLLQAGTRPEELAEQREKVQRAKGWCDLAKRDLERKRNAFQDELVRLDEQISLSKIQVAFAEQAMERGRKLLEKKSLPLDTYQDLERQFLTGKTVHTQAEAHKRERLALGTLEQEAELARREKDHHDAKAVLKLLEVGPRAEEIEAERSRLARLLEEKTYLDSLGERVRLVTPLAGVMITPHLREKVGQHFKEGDLICEIEDLSVLEVEIPLEEQDIQRIACGCAVELKPRSLPFQTYKTEVHRIGAQATVGKAQSTVNVCCRLTTEDAELRSGMTGYARISCGRQSVLGLGWQRAYRYFRTEFWW